MLLGLWWHTTRLLHSEILSLCITFIIFVFFFAFSSIWIQLYMSGKSGWEFLKSVNFGSKNTLLNSYILVMAYKTAINTINPFSFNQFLNNLYARGNLVIIFYNRWLSLVISKCLIFTKLHVLTFQPNIVPLI